MIQFEYQSDFLKFRYPFRIAHGERLGTDVVFIVMRIDGIVGFGEATLPPYLGVSTENVLEALSRSGIADALALSTPDDWFQSLLEIIPDNMPALAALDMARWQIYLAQSECCLAEIIGLQQGSKKVPHTFTLGVSDKKEMQEKIRFAEAQGFKLFKLKLDGRNDCEVLSNFRSFSSAPFAIDANQAWKQLEQGLGMLDLLEEEGCILIEQPFHKSDRSLSQELCKRTAIPVIADEACCLLDEVEEVLQFFDGINVKLQKCGGITPALKQLQLIQAQGKRALIGCMSESSVGCNAAEQLAFLCDWADLDGPYLNANNAELCGNLGYSL
jgi:L-alanine-DL-glutamate epimerase-like enolase superfamily enzyme